MSDDKIQDLELTIDSLRKVIETLEKRNRRLETQLFLQKRLSRRSMMTIEALAKF